VQNRFGRSWLIPFIIIKKSSTAFVNLSQFTTIGANGGRQAAEIGDNVYIGPNVCIIEYVKIGNNATIGAGSVVTKDIPENATAAGNYAKVLSTNHPGSSVNRRWTDI